MSAVVPPDFDLLSVLFDKLFFQIVDRKGRVISKGEVRHLSQNLNFGSQIQWFHQ